MSDICPVCGKGEHEIVGVETLRLVSHLACVETLHVTYVATYKMEHENMQRAEKAEAELAALKGRRCETCRRDYAECQIQFDPQVTRQPDFSCSEWAEREKT